MKISLSSELVYVLAILLLGLGVAFTSIANFGVSMIAAPAYLLSLKTNLLFGQCEMIIQGIVFLVFCFLVGRIRISYFWSFLTCVLYGFALDFWRMLLPSEVSSFAFEILFFIVGVLLTAFSIALFFRTYLYPAVFDFFVKGLCHEKQLSSTKFKIIFDFSCLFFSLFFSFFLFHKLKGIGIGTVIMTFVNGALIGFFGKIIDRFFEVKPSFASFSKYFDL